MPSTQPNDPLIRPEEDNPALANVMERNIRTIIALRQKADRSRALQDRIADAITSTSGTMVFLYFHLAWFSAWILLNTGWFGFPPFDPFPYGLLTMLVSLDAICLSIFVLISQKRNSAEAEQRADLALQIGLLTEHELTQALKMLDAIQDRMDIDNNEDQDLVELEMETMPEDVLAEIDKVRQRIK